VRGIHGEKATPTQKCLYWTTKVSFSAPVTLRKATKKNIRKEIFRMLSSPLRRYGNATVQAYFHNSGFWGAHIQLKKPRQDRMETPGYSSTRTSLSRYSFAGCKEVESHIPCRVSWVRNPRRLFEIALMMMQRTALFRLLHWELFRSHCLLLCFILADTPLI
jgi:hypothetical protein